jgi:type IV pilus assembly protein PilA
VRMDRFRHAKCNSSVEVEMERMCSSGIVIRDRGDAMRRTKGFSLIELLIVVAIILVIAAIAIPSFLHSRMAANESAAAAAIRTLNTAQISFDSAYPTVGFASTLAVLGGSGANCTPPTSTSACLIDSNLAGGQRSGYYFTLTNVTGTPNSTYNVIATPILVNYSGVRYFCSYADAVVRVSLAAITTCDGSVPPQQ